MTKQDPTITYVSSDPKVSVIMPVLNGERFVRQAIASILEQTFADFEFIIIEDGSTDSTARILESFSDQRIRILSNDRNLGVTRSLNRALSVARGQLIARQDADDISDVRRIERQVAFLDSNPLVGVVGVGSRWVDEKGETLREWQPPSNPEEIQQKILRGLPILHATIMFRKTCLDDIGGAYNENLPVAQDTDFLFRLSEPWDVANISEVLYQVRRHADSVTSRRASEQSQILMQSQLAAVRRRIMFGRMRLGLSRGEVPEWLKKADRRWLATRLAWWSACSRPYGRMAALEMLALAFLLDPTAPDIWSYVSGITRRKLGFAKRDNPRPWFG